MSGLLAWVWENFPAERLKVRFIPGVYNKEADVLSRWGTDWCDYKRGEKERLG